MKHFGDRLVRVRYRRDTDTGKHIKTAEIIVDEAIPAPSEADQNPHEPVSMKVEYHDTHVREKVKAAGGRWDPKHLVRRLPRHRVHHLHLQHRIVSPPKESQT